MKEKTTFKHFNPMKLREKYSAKSYSGSNSSFWMGDNFGRRTSIFDGWNEDEVEVKKPSVDTIALASYRRSISNFVNIVTGRSDINVKFNDGDDSYTDGKKVVISSNIKAKNFDSTVGLALHEGSHILLSDFEFLRNLAGGFVTDNETILKAANKGYSKPDVLSHLKMLLNYVEDRRIDYHIFKNSPGYKGYYHSMYKTYFHSNVIDKALKSDEYTSNDWNSYLFRIINLTNENRNLKAVTDLDKIYNLLFVENHPSTIKDTRSAFEIAVSIYHIILDNLDDGVEDVDENTGEVSTKPASDSNSTEDGKSGSGGKSEPKELSDEEFEGLKKAVEDGNVGSSGSSEGSEIVLTEAQKKSLDKAFNKQKDFVAGKTKKTKLAKKWATEINAVEESGMRLTDVGGKELGEFDWRTDSYGKGTTKCVVIDRITDGLLENDLCEVLRKNCYGADDRAVIVAEGMRLGTMLGRKLKVRNESRDTKWTRKDSGRIDKRLIAELGFGNERVFTTTFNDSYADAHLHISIDASGSMGGDKWDSTMKATIAICKAASMIQNVDVVVSFRTTHSGRNGRIRGTDYPLVLIAYDSRVDKFSKVKNLFPYIVYGGTTPEGLCFEAIMNEIVPASNDRESYFLNFSDGMPMFSNDEIRYYHDDAILHTKKMVDELRNRGISILSYYIGDSYDRNDSLKDFRKMYGKDAQFIDINSVMGISKTMNDKFLEKTNNA